jgi:cephalosporin-C deacetylase
LIVKLIEHPFHFNPSYGYDLEGLLAITPPSAPADFVQFWQARYRKTLALRIYFTLGECGSHSGLKTFDVNYQSTDGFTIGGWLLEPEDQEVRQCIIVGHGYGGRNQPDYHFNIPHTAYLFPCFRGISRSRSDQVSDQPASHVLHHIDDPERYILGGCVEDLWLAVTLMLELYPHAKDRIGYMGISFGGGIGALGLPWDNRVQKIHLNVPTFGCNPLRLELPSLGSAAAVSQYVKSLGHVPDTLAYYDAAITAQFAQQPLHMAAALFDPMVAPPGQFCIYNAWSGSKDLFVLDAGHYEYPRQQQQNQQLLWQLQAFFAESTHPS